MHFSIATRDDKEKSTAVSNLLALCISQKYDDLIDTLVSANDFKDDIAFQTNKIVASNVFKKDFEINLNKSFITDTILNDLSLPYGHNYAVSNLGNVPEELIKKINTTSKQESLNTNTINYLQGLILLSSKNGWRGKEILERLAKDSDPAAQNYYYKLLGFMFLKNENYTLAENTLSNNAKIQLFRAFDDAPLANAVANFASGNYEKFKKNIDHISYTDSTNKKLAKELLFAINASENEYLNLNDVQKSYYFISHPNTDPFLIKGIGNPDIKAFTINEVAKQLLEENKLKEINTLWEELPAKEYDFVTKTDLNIKLAKKEFQEVLNLTKGTKHYYERAVAYDSLNMVEEANIVYNKGLSSTPFDTKLIIAASDFMAYKMDEDETSYNLILDAVINDKLNVDAKKAYIKRCLEQHLRNFAQSVQDDLAEMISDEELREFALKTQFDVADYHAAHPEKQQLEFID